MNSTDFEIFYNWGNTLSTNDKIQFKKIQSQISNLKKNHSVGEMEEILVANGYKYSLVKEALSEKKEVKTAQAEPVTMPKKYADIAPRIEQTLKELGSNKFVSLLTKGTNPLMKLSKKQVETFQKLADSALEDSIYFDALHSYMKPSIVSELCENVRIARKIKDFCKIDNKDNLYKIHHNGKVVEASISPVKSTSAKYKENNYSYFNFPDEYVILAYEESSPYSKIKKDLNI